MGKCILAGHPPVGGQVGYGTYIGDDTASRFINLGVTPKWVLLVCQTGQMVDSYGTGSADVGGLALQGRPPIIANNPNYPVFKIEGTGFYVYCSGSSSNSQTNVKGMYYNYIYGT